MPMVPALTVCWRSTSGRWASRDDGVGRVGLPRVDRVLDEADRPIAEGVVGASRMVARLRNHGHRGAVVLLDDRVQVVWMFGAYIAVAIVSVLPATHQCQQFWSDLLKRP